MAEQESKLVVAGQEYPVPDSFTLGELADMEKITGQGYDLGKGGTLGTLALIYVAVKRKDPTVSIDDIRGLGPDDIEVNQVDPPSIGALPDAPNEKKQSSSEGSSPTSDGSGSDLNGTGQHGSGDTAASALETLNT